MSVLDDLSQELSRLKRVEEENGYLKADKKRMSEELFTLMMEKYERTSLEERTQIFKRHMCSACRYSYGCERPIPEDIWKPSKSDKDWIPGYNGCPDFKWD